MNEVVFIDKRIGPSLLKQVLLRHHLALPLQ